MDNNQKKDKEAAHSATSFTTTELSSILEMLDKYEVKEFCLERSGEKLSLKRGQEVAPITINQTQPMAQPFVAPMQQLAAPSMPQVAAPSATIPLTQAAKAETPKVTENKKYKEVTSPMVGTFYRRPAVDAEPYVQAGDAVKKGDILCIIEAMKLMNEIESDTSGKIVEVCIEDGQMVEYGEVLFRIE